MLVFIQRVRRIAIVFLSTALVVISLVGVPAGATTTHVGSPVRGTHLGARLVGGTITGTVTNTSNVGIGGVCVTAQLGNTVGGSATTASNGSYTISSAPAGTYTVYFYPECASVTSTYAQQSIGSVIVSAGGTTTQNATLALGGIITGTVTNASNVGIGSVCVNAFLGLHGYGDAPTANNGSYTIASLPVGNYEVRVDATCSGTVTSTYDEQLIGSVIVSAGGITTQNATLVAYSGTITGTVTNASNVGIGGVCVTAQAQLGIASQFFRTASNGSYTISGLAAGVYTVSFDPTCLGSVTSTYAQRSIGSVIVSAGSTTQNVTLGTSIGSITGTVTNTSHVGIAGVCVSVNIGNTSYGLVLTTRGGSYTIPALAAGVYTVSFDPTCNSLKYAQRSIGSVIVSAGSTTQNVTLVTLARPTTRARPTTLNVGFAARRSSLGLSQERALTALAKKLVAGASVVTTGYAKANTALARSRARAVAKFLSSRVRFKIHVTLKTSTNTAANKVTVSTTRP